MILQLARRYSLSFENQTSIGSYLVLSRADLRWISPADGTCVKSLLEQLPGFNCVGRWTISGWVMMRDDWVSLQTRVAYQH